MQYGYFDDEKREYVITRPDTPAPWANYLGSPEYGAIISNNAGGYSFAKSGANGRILRYVFNDFDQPGFGAAEVETVFPARAAADLNRREWELAMLIAQGQRSCLQQPGEVNRILIGNRSAVSATVKRLLHKKGLASASGQVNYQGLSTEFLNFYGPDLLRRTGLLGEQRQIVWLKELYRDTRLSPNVLKMVLGGIFLAGSFEAFLSEIEVTYREAA